MNIKMPTARLSGQFRLVVSDGAGDGGVKHDTGYFDNLITDAGLNRIGTVVSGDQSSGGSSVKSFSDVCGQFHVGAGSAVPQFTDTALQSPIAYAASNVSLVNESSNYDRGWFEITVRHEFAMGTAAGNISEIGIQRGATGPLWSRALVLDASGNPTTITVLETDILTCYYTLKIMIPKEDAVFNIDVDYGDDGIVPTVVTGRPLSANSTSVRDGWGFTPHNRPYLSSASQFDFYSGGLNAPTATTPLGSRLFRMTGYPTSLPYTPGSFVRHFKTTAGLTEFNSNNLRTCSIPWMMGMWQIEFNPPLEKENTQTMDFTFGYSWARA